AHAGGAWLEAAEAGLAVRLGLGGHRANGLYRTAPSLATIGPMITHVVLFKLKDRSETAVETTRQVLLAMRGRIPELLQIEVGADQLHSERSYDIALITQHASWEALDAYQVHPVHQGVGVHM